MRSSDLAGRWREGLIALLAALNAEAATVPEREFALYVSHGTVAQAQRVLPVEKGDVVRILVSSDAPGAVHLHGYRLEAKVRPDEPARLEFRAHATGRYPIQWHDAVPGQRAAPGHGPRLSTLEVRPR